MTGALRVMASRRAAKAYVAAGVAALAYLGPVVDDGLAGSEVCAAAGIALGAFQLTYWTRNARQPADEPPA